MKIDSGGKMDFTLVDIAKFEIIPHLKKLISNILVYRENVSLDGVEVFKSGDVFLAGKIVNGACYVLTMIDSDEEKEIWIKNVRNIIEFTAPMEMKTWGYLNYLMGLYRLKENNLLDKVLDVNTLQILKESIDWKKFVNLEDLSLISLPTNYYGVAYSVARYRELLGWDDGNYSQLLFDKLLDHVEKYSGKFLFMDETAGEGRFDRYSILIPGEICSMLTSTGLEIPDTVKKMLRQSADICIKLANKAGNGISYGRSIGAYGDTAILEVLSIAAKLNILTKEELKIAYGYNVMVAKKFVSFWIDPDMKSVNMWENGRRTDGYRHKGRILGENFSLSCQILHITHQWMDIEFADKEVDKDWEHIISKLPNYNYFTFSKGDVDRGLIVIRDKGHVFSLPLINGGGGTSGDVHGKSYYFASPYLPIPNESMVLETPSDTFFSQLTPRLVMTNGKELMPIAYMKEIETDYIDSGYIVTYKQDSLCSVGKRYPEIDASVKSTSTYRFKSGMIEKTDTFYVNNIESVDKIVMEFLTFSKGVNQKGSCVNFDEGPIKSIEVEGLNIESYKTLENLNEYNTSHGKLFTRINYFLDTFKLNQPIIVKWKINY